VTLPNAVIGCEAACGDVCKPRPCRRGIRSSESTPHSGIILPLRFSRTHRGNVAFAKGALAPFWSLATEILDGPARAGGIALVNSLGCLGGFVGPKLFAAHKGPIGLLLLAASFLLFSVVVLFFRARRGGARLRQSPLAIAEPIQSAG
jgi:hypothetical protein